MAKTKTSTKTKNTARPTKAASRKTKASVKAAPHKGRSAGEKEVPVDRRRASRRDEEKAAAAPKLVVAPVALERRQKVNRRRQIDPTTCERDYTDDEVEFMNALDVYKRKNGRMFPTCSEVLEVVRSLGYVRLSPTELAARATTRPPEFGIVTEAVEEIDEDEVSLSSNWQ